MLKLRLGEEREVKVRFHHEHDPQRPFIAHVGDNCRLVNGITTCKIFESCEDAEETFTGWAECSTKDRYNKEVGRKVSLKRALWNAHFEYEERKKIWEAYFARLATPARKENGHAHSGIGSGS